MAQPQNTSGPPLCARCRHHFVTYDPALPHGCRAFGIRTRTMPCQVVEAQSGAPCQAVEQRPTPPRSS